MKENIIKMKGRDDPFARVPKDVLNDENLSWRAKGIFSYIIGKPAGWTILVQDIWKKGKEGRDAVRNALQELRREGYADLVTVYKDGRADGKVWKISDSKIYTIRKPEVQSSSYQKPENWNSGFQEVNKNDYSKNDLNKNESTERDDLYDTRFPSAEIAEQWKEMREKLQG